MWDSFFIAVSSLEHRGGIRRQQEEQKHLNGFMAEPHLFWHEAAWAPSQCAPVLLDKIPEYECIQKGAQTNVPPPV